MGSFVDLIDNFEYCVTDVGAYVKVNCDATMFITDVIWFVRDLIVILFRLKNLIILLLFFFGRKEFNYFMCCVLSDKKKAAIVNIVLV